MTIDYQVLREAAEKATPDEWVAFISTDTGTYAVHTPGDERCEDVIKWTGFDGQKNAENNARHVAAFNPKVALELLGEIKRLEDTNIDAMCRIAELETNLAALAAENAGLKSGAMDEIKVINRGGQAYCVKDGVRVNPMYARGWNDYRAKSLQSDTPATDAFLAEVRAKAFDDLCAAFVKHASVSWLDDGDCVTVKEATDALLHCAEQLHKGVHS
ncbi:EA22-like protein; similarities with EA22 from lambda (modular protein involved in blocking host replication) [Escherichia coli]|uniref:ead/Ea22-like family protein n=1 Tax=Escherichia coli TaxID=562 RepID=UPI000E068287|nr:ead/Ea22-like family protein [Escherichia coli]EFG9129787.1 ead/Ea22-like family protein [Escherichia coli]STL23089.1 EA22-like protein; similarities with EA22 from lambda (modular protein involved in blocking host replication) [Escherichia coli]HAH8858897.1 ead/Ea22-like family protein [Escherichia coli]